MENTGHKPDFAAHEMGSPPHPSNVGGNHLRLSPRPLQDAPAERNYLAVAASQRALKPHMLLDRYFNIKQWSVLLAPEYVGVTRTPARNIPVDGKLYGTCRIELYEVRNFLLRYPV